MGIHKILVLEDDADFRVEIVDTLEESFDVSSCNTIATFWQQFRQVKPEVVLLDLGLPDGRGSDVIRDLRGIDCTLGILVLSGKLDEADRVIALEFGADDFLMKPCGERELIARINAVLRRVSPNETATAQSNVASFSSFTLDFLSMQLCNQDRETIPLTTAEFALLKVLVENAQVVLSRDRLLNLLRGDDWSGYDRSIDGLVYRLRKKLRKSTQSQSILKTVHGSGYIFTPEVRFQ